MVCRRELTLQLAARPQGICSVELAAIVVSSEAWAATRLHRLFDHGLIQVLDGTGHKGEPRIYCLTELGRAELAGEPVDPNPHYDCTALLAAMGYGLP